MQDIESEVRQTLKELQGLSGIPPASLTFDYSKTTSSKTEKSKLSVNIPQLKEIIDVIGISYKKDIIRLVLAHELGHILQYQFYSNIHGSLLYECQADIIAGYLLFQLAMNDLILWNQQAGITDIDNPKYVDRMKQLNDKVLASLSAIFRAGSNVLDNKTHPSNEERRLALRDGFNYGTMWLYTEVMPNIPELKGQPLSKADIKKMASRFRQNVNYLPADNLITWSYRQSKKITHDNLLNCKDILVYTTIDWDTSADSPFAYYEQKIINKGNKTLTLSFDNQVYTARRTDAANSLYWNLQSSRSYSFTLSPGQVREISDSLEWIATKDYMPHLVYLGRRGSHFSCTSLSDVIPNPSTIVVGNHYANMESTSASDMLESFLTTRPYFDEYIGGVGDTYDEKFSGTITYGSRIFFPEASNTTVEYTPRRKRYDMRVDYYKGPVKSKAQQKLQELQQQFIHSSLSLQEHTHEKGSEDRAWDIMHEGEQIGSLYLFHLKSGDYVLHFTIEGISS